MRLPMIWCEVNQEVRHSDADIGQGVAGRALLSSLLLLQLQLLVPPALTSAQIFLWLDSSLPTVLRVVEGQRD